MRSSDPPFDSTGASTRESAFLPFSATSEYDCSGSSFRLPVRSANRIRRTGHRIRTANGTVSRSSPPKKRTSRAEAQDRAEARAGHTPVQPKSDTMSRTARQTRDSPKQVELCSPHSTCSPRTASAELGTSACRRQRPKPRHQLTEHRSTHSRPSHTRRTSPPRSSADPAPSHRRGNATGTSRSIAEATYRTIRLIRSRVR